MIKELFVHSSSVSPVHNLVIVGRSCIVAQWFKRRTLSQEVGGSTCCHFEARAISFTPLCISSLRCINECLAVDSSLRCINEYLAVDSGGHIKD